MKRILVVILIFYGLETAYSQDKLLFNIKTDTIVFVNFNKNDLSAQKKTKLLEARSQNRISDAWDLEQFYTIDSKWFRRYMEKLEKELDKEGINYRFISISDNSRIGENYYLTTNFKVEESKSGKNLIIFMTSILSNKNGKQIMDGDAAGIIKQLRDRK